MSATGDGPAHTGDGSVADPRFPRWGETVVALLLACGVLAEVLLPEPYSGLSLLAAAPLAACMVLPLRKAVLTAGAACVASAATAALMGDPLTTLLVDLGDVTLVGCVAVWLKRTVQHQRLRLGVVEDIAEVVQRAVLPATPRSVGALSVASRYEGVHPGALIGGDFYAVQDSPFGVRVVLGDVRGKGLPAVSAMALLTGAFREAALQAPDLPELAGRLDAVLAEFDAAAHTAIAQAGGPEEVSRFATAVFVEFPHEGGDVRLLNRGHPPPFLLRGGEVVCVEADETYLPLGLGLPDVADPGSCEAFSFRAGEFLLLVSDGVTEARDHRGVFYDLGRRLAERAFDGPRDLVDTLAADVFAWTGGQQHDDIAILAVHRPTSAV